MRQKSRQDLSKVSKNCLQPFSIKSAYDPKNKSFQKYARLTGFSKQSKMVFFFCCKFFYYANLVADDVTVSASTVVCHKIKNISANNEAMLLKLDRHVAPYEIYQMVNILLLLWQQARFQSLSLQNQISPFVAAWGKTHN